jgi:hypothetical protein
MCREVALIGLDALPEWSDKMKQPLMMRLLAFAASGLAGIRRFVKRFAQPGTGPFLAGC